MVFSYFGVWLVPKPSGALCSWSRKPPGEVEFGESEGGRGQLARGVPVGGGQGDYLSSSCRSAVGAA